MPPMTPGVPSALSPLVRRIIAPNPGPFTGPGTNTYLVGIDEVAVIDPGPDNKKHIDSIIGASMKERVRWVLLTHTHPDHSPGAARIKKATGAEVLAFAPEAGIPIDRTIGDNAMIDGTEFGLQVLHTPGHAPNHLCFLLEEERVLFTGDLILEGTTTVVSPETGGDMVEYLKSLERLKKMRLSRIAPGHGDVIEEPKPYIDYYLKHRAQRERQILNALKKKPAKIPQLVSQIYTDTPVEMHPIAEHQVHAHLIKLKVAGKVSGRDARSTWKIA